MVVTGKSSSISQHDAVLPSFVIIRTYIMHSPVWQFRCCSWKTRNKKEAEVPHQSSTPAACTDTLTDCVSFHYYQHWNKTYLHWRSKFTLFLQYTDELHSAGFLGTSKHIMMLVYMLCAGRAEERPVRESVRIGAVQMREWRRVCDSAPHVSLARKMHD